MASIGSRGNETYIGRATEHLTDDSAGDVVEALGEMFGSEGVRDGDDERTVREFHSDRSAKPRCVRPTGDTLLDSLQRVLPYLSGIHGVASACHTDIHPRGEIKPTDNDPDMGKRSNTQCSTVQANWTHNYSPGEGEAQ